MKSESKSNSDLETSAYKKSELNFEEAFELTGHGKFNHIVLLTCGLIMLNVSMESVGMSYVITAAECDLHMSSEHKGMVNAAAFIGIVSTSFIWGYLGDRIGRKAVMLPALTASAVASIASSFSVNFWMLLILRIITGCLVSASSATVYAYLGETHINARRAAAIAWGSSFISFSFIILPGLAWTVIPGEWSFAIGSMTIVPWRVFMWSWCAPGILAAVILLMLPESPRYLFSAKGSDKALTVLATMYSWNHGVSAEKFQVRTITQNGNETTKTGGFAGAIKNMVFLVKPPLLKCVIISHISMFAVFMLSSGLYMWVPDILNSLLQNHSENSISICEIIHNKFEAKQNTTVILDPLCKTKVSETVFPISMGMGAVFALVYLAIGVLINRIGRKLLYCGIMVIGGVATMAAAFVPQGSAATALLVVALSIGCCASILAAIAVDVFPTCLRAMAMCTMYMTGRLGAAVGSNILGITLNTHCHLAFCVFGIFTSGSTILMIFWPKPERVREKVEERGLVY